MFRRMTIIAALLANALMAAACDITGPCEPRQATAYPSSLSQYRSSGWTCTPGPSAGGWGSGPAYYNCTKPC